MEEPLISVIMPAYKAEKYISDALESIAAQTYSNWEVIVVEDAWRDKTEEIVREFACNLPKHRIEFIRHAKNRGLGATRNTAIQFAKGKYLAFLDHDDIWKPAHLEEAVKALLEQNADLAYSTVLMFKDGTNEELGLWGPTTEEIKNFPASLSGRNYITPSAVVMKKGALEEVGLMDIDEKVHGCEDYDCWIKMSIAGFKFVYIEGVNCLYRKHLFAMTSNHKLMTEKILYVMKKHQDWTAVPREVYRQRIVNLYSQLGELNMSEEPWKAARFFLYAWLQKPMSFYHAKRLIKVLASQMQLVLSNRAVS